MIFLFVRSPSSVVAADGVGDPGSTRIVYLSVVALLLLGVLFLVLGMWLFRRTRPDLELLLPLEQMDSRSWRRRDPATQLRLLDESRPAGAVPLRKAALEPSIDSEFAALRPVTSFDDLIGDRVAAESAGEHAEQGEPADEAEPDATADGPDQIGPALPIDAVEPVPMTGDRDEPDRPLESDEATEPAPTFPAGETHKLPAVKDETLEIGRPSAVAHDALMLAIGAQGDDAGVVGSPEPTADVVADAPDEGVPSTPSTSEFTIAFADRRPPRRRDAH